MNKSKGLVTIPTDVDVVSGTLELMERWGADALRDCDGTDFPQELRDVDAKIYSTYYTTRKDNDWARQNPDEIQQMYLMTPFYTASGTSLSIHLMKGLYPDMLTPNTRDDIKRWWEVVDRTTGKVVSPTHWSYCEETGDVTIETVPFHEYTVSFLAYIMWDPVHMYNAVTNSWKGVEHQITFDVRQPKTHAFQRREVAKIVREMVDITHEYGGYLKLAMQFPDFLDYVEQVCNEFRELYQNVKGTVPYCFKKVAVLNCWGKMRAWGCHMVHHALYQKQNYSYAGVIEALSGAPFDVVFLSFQDLLDNPDILKDIDVIINVGDADTAHTGGEWWIYPQIQEIIRRFVYESGGIIGVGEPSGHQYQGHFFQLANVFGVEEEHGFTLGYDKYNWEEHSHFILEDVTGDVDFGEGKKNIYALEHAEILVQRDKEVQMAVNTFGKGRAVYISGLPYSFENSRILHRAILWSSSDEEALLRWFSTNYNVDVHAYPENGKYCVVNNTDDVQETTIYRGDGSSFEKTMQPNEIIWYEI